MSPDWATKPEAVPYSSLSDPQTLNLYGYMRNNPLGGTDPDGHCGQQSSDGGSGHCPNVNVQVDSAPHVMTNVPLSKGQSVSGVGTTTTITLTNSNGTPAAGVPVKESPTTKNDLTGKATNAMSNPQTVPTSSQGTIKDIVMQPATSIPISAEDASIIGQVVSEAPLSKTTSQTLTFPGQGCTCQATYSETLSNVGSSGKLNPMNSTGTNVTLTVTTPTVKQIDPK